MKKQIVLGTFFGDEGKGSTVQWLCKEAIDRGEKPLVIRYSGGSQAGHRIVCNGIEHVCSSFGSGTLLGVPTYLNENVMIDPISTKIEFEELQKKGIKPRLIIDPELKIITPYDVAANRSDKQVLSHGSCGEGIYHTFKRGVYGKELTFWKAMHNPHYTLNEVRNYYNADSNKELDDKFVEAIQWLTSFAEKRFESHAISKFDTLIFEGSQGLLLDMDCGFMPHCTPSWVGLNGVPKRFLNFAEVFMVMRSYLTRHGNGYNPFREDVVREYFTLDEPTNRNDGFQGVFKYGVFDENLLRRVIDRHHIDNLKREYNLSLNGVVTHIDCAIMDCIPFLDRKLDFTRGTIKQFLSYQSLYFDKMYGSYSSELSNEQFKLVNL